MGKWEEGKEGNCVRKNKRSEGRKGVLTTDIQRN